MYVHKRVVKTETTNVEPAAKTEKKEKNKNSK